MCQEQEQSEESLIDDGGNFRTSFIEEMHRLGVKHLEESAYNSSSKGGAERVLRSIKEYLRKENIQRVTQELLQKLTFRVTNKTQNGKSGSAVEHSWGENQKACCQTALKEKLIGEACLKRGQLNKQSYPPSQAKTAQKNSNQETE